MVSCTVALVEEPTRLLHLPDIPLKVQGPHSGVNTRMAPGHQIRSAVGRSISRRLPQDWYKSSSDVSSEKRSFRFCFGSIPSEGMLISSLHDDKKLETSILGRSMKILQYINLMLIWKAPERSIFTSPSLKQAHRTCISGHFAQSQSSHAPNKGSGPMQRSPALTGIKRQDVRATNKPQSVRHSVRISK